MPKSCTLPWPFRAAELVLKMVLVTPEMEMVEEMVISLVTTQVFPPAVAQVERAEKVETEEVARSRGCGKSWPKGCMVLPVLFKLDARPCPFKKLRKRHAGEKKNGNWKAHEG